MQLEANGDITTNAMIDREQSSPIRDELYLFVEAQDWGHRVALTSYILAAVEIKDENDNPPTFELPQISFLVLENGPSPYRIGEILVHDADAGSPKGVYQEVFPESLLPSPPRVSEPPKHVVSVVISAAHGLPDLPFVIDSDSDGRFYLNVTRSLDREVEEIFRFHILASDYGGPSHLRHTSTATVTVSVADVNDNHPEIIFPKHSHVHALSYLEMPGAVVLGINANDKDSEGENGKFVFELGPAVSSCPGADASRLAKTALDGDLFKVDNVKGLLKTQRRMNDADLGEHWLQLIVRDLGSPPLETRQITRLSVDRSLPRFASNIRAHTPSRQRPPSLGNDILDPHYRHAEGWNVGGRSISDVVMMVVISLMIASFIVLIGLCLYLRHRRKLFFCLPDMCALFQKPRPFPNPNSESEYASRSNKAKEDKQEEEATEETLRGRIRSPLSPLSLLGGQFVVPSSKGIPGGGGGAFVTIANGLSRCPVDGIQSTVTDVSNLFERPPKLCTDYYHVGLLRNQATAHSSQLVPNPMGFLKSTISPNEETPSPKANLYNAATTGAQSSSFSTIHRSHLGPNSGRSGEPLSSLYVQSISAVGPRHCRLFAPVVHTDAVTMVRHRNEFEQNPYNSKMNFAQGSCDLLAFTNSLGLGRSDHKSSHFKSEPSLTACRILEDDDTSDLHDPNEVLASGSSGVLLDNYLGDAPLFTSVVVSGDRNISTILPAHQQQSLENYAVSFPKPQASYV